MIILNKKFIHEGQDFEIFIKYDEEEKKPVEVKNILIHTHGSTFPIGNLMTKFFADAIWELITKADWEAVNKDFEDTNWNNLQTSINSLPALIGAAFRPFLVTGGELKTITN